jgi:hypothetical protein
MARQTGEADPTRSFFESAGPGRYLGTKSTAGPWSAQAQHGGPPSALAARELEHHEPDERMRLARVAIDILRPVPVGLLTARTRMLRPGKRVALLETVLESDGQEVLYARGWRIARWAAAPVITKAGAVPQVPDTRAELSFPGGHIDGYLSEIDWRYVSGSFAEPGPCTVWARPRIPLLPDEDISPMSRTLLVADSGNGVSMTVDPREFLFINVDLTVVLHRDPVGDWLLLDAVSTMGGTGTGLAETQLCDVSGVIGTGIQTLVVGPR